MRFVIAVLLTVATLLSPTLALDRSVQVRVIGAQPSGRDSPQALMRKSDVQQLAFAVSERKVRPAEARKMLKDPDVTLEKLLDAGLFSIRDNALQLDFVFLTVSDRRKIMMVARDYGGRLAERLRAREPQLDEAISQYPLKSVDPRLLRYMLIGCFSLDWDGLQLARERSLRRAEHDGAPYILVAEEKSDELSLRGLYWGSHQVFFGESGEYVMTTFGDHHSLPRSAFPDFAFFLPNSERQDILKKYPGAYGEALIALFVDGDSDSAMRAAVKTMASLRSGPQSRSALADASGLSASEADSLLAVLTHTGYIAGDGQFEAQVPVFSEEDGPIVRRVLEIGREEIDGWIGENYDQLRADLSSLDLMKHNVSYEEAYSHLWHYVFAYANLRLVEAGYFYDPYGEDVEWTGFAPMIWASSLDPQQ